MADIYIAPSPTGNDANPGTIGSPKLTLSAALAALNAAGGATGNVFCAAGTYNLGLQLDVTYSNKIWTIAPTVAGTLVTFTNSAGQSHGLTIAAGASNFKLNFNNITFTGAYSTAVLGIYSTTGHIGTSGSSLINTGASAAVIYSAPATTATGTITLVDTTLQSSASGYYGLVAVDKGAASVSLSGCTLIGLTNAVTLKNVVGSLRIDATDLNITKLVLRTDNFMGAGGSDELTDYCDVVSITNCTGTVGGVVRIPESVRSVVVRGNAWTNTAAGSRTWVMGYEVIDIAARAASHAYALNAIVKPTTNNGRLYQATNIGSAPNQTAAGDPTGGWSTTVGATIADGDITWTVIAAETSATRPILAYEIAANTINWTNAASSHVLFIGVTPAHGFVAGNVLTGLGNDWGVVVKGDNCLFFNNVIALSHNTACAFYGSLGSRIFGNTIVGTKNNSAANTFVMSQNQQSDYSLLVGLTKNALVINNVFKAVAGVPFLHGSSTFPGDQTYYNAVNSNLYWTDTGTNIAYISGAYVAKSGGLAAVRARWQTVLNSKTDTLMWNNDSDSLVADPKLNVSYRPSVTSPVNGSGAYGSSIGAGPFNSGRAANNRLGERY